MTLQEIWEKHYKDRRITKKTFKELVSLDPTTIKDDSGEPLKPGRYTKWILRSWQNKTLLEEDFYKVTEYLTPLSRFRFVTKGLDIMKAKTLPDLYEMVHELLDRKSQKESMEAIKTEGLVCLYNKAPWQVYRVDTWDASKLIGAGTQWCTASKYSNSNFISYTRTGPLIVFVRNNKEKYQYHRSVGLYSASDRLVTDNAILAEVNPIVTKLRKEIFGISFEVDEICLNNEYRTVIKFKGMNLELNKKFFDDRFILANKITNCSSGRRGSCLSSYRSYRCHDNSDYVILNARTGDIVENILNVAKPEFFGKKNDVVVIRDSKHRIQEFIVFDNEFGVRKFKTNIKDYLVNCWYGVDIERAKDKINVIVAGSKMHQVDIPTGKVLKTYNVYVKTESEGGTKKYYKDPETDEFIGTQPPINTGIWHGARRNVKHEPLISEYLIFRGDGKKVRFRYNKSCYDCVNITIENNRVKYGTKNVIFNWPKSKDIDIVYIQNPGFNGLTNNGQRRIIITPYGWTFWNGSAAIKATEAVWYTIDPSKYLGSIDCLWKIEIQGKNKKPKNLGRKKYSWFEHLFDLYCA